MDLDEKPAFAGAPVTASAAGSQSVRCFEETTPAVGWLALACITFTVGIWASLPQDVSWRQIVFSYLMSSGRNPHGYRYAASGLVLCSFFLLPVAGRLRYAFPATRMTQLAAILSVIGISALTFMGTLAFAVDKLGSFHDDVTTVSLFGILASMLLYLSQISFRGSGWPRVVAAAMIPSLLGTIAFLFYVFAKPDYVNVDAPVWRSLAALEWSVVSFIAIYLLLLLFLGAECRKERRGILPRRRGAEPGIGGQAETAP